MLRFILFIFCFLSIHNVYAQKLSYKNYTTKNGLAHDITYQIIQDNKGFIWIGTDDGLSKFNGTSFKNYSYENGLKSNYVIDIIEDKPNEFLIATWGAGLHYLKNDSIYKPKIKNDDLIRIQKIYKLNDSLIYGTSAYHGFMLYNTKQKTLTKHVLIKKNEKTNISLAPPKKAVKHIQYISNQKKNNNTLYLFSSEKKFPKKTNLKGLYTLKNLKIKKSSYPFLNNIKVHAINSDKNFFYAASQNKIFSFKNKQLINRMSLPIKNEVIFNLKVKQHKFYFTTYNSIDGSRKMYIYNQKKNILVNISKKLNITNFISDFLLDNNSNLWITTYGQGVYYLPNHLSTFFNNTTFSSSDLKDIKKVNNFLFISTPNTLYKFENDIIKNQKKLSFHSERFQINKQSKKIEFIHIKKLKSQVNISDFKIITKLSKKFYFTQDSITVQLSRNFAIFSKNGKTILKKSIHNKDSYLDKALLHNGKIYAIYNKLGIAILDLKNTEKITWWNKKNKFFTNRFKGIVVKNNIIWLASDIGIIKITGHNKTRYTTKNGLLSNHINDLTFDSHGVLWAATQKGLNVLNEDYFYTIDDNLGQKSSFTTKIIEHNNHIYVTGNNGLFKFKNIIPFSPKSNTKLLITQNKSNFVLHTVNYINPESIEIEYQLNDNSWTKTNSEKLKFQNSKQGKYFLKFRHKDNLSNWKNSKTYHFKISYPWHQQTWFYVLITFIILGIVTLLLFIGLQKSNKKNDELKRSIKEKEKLQNDLKEVRKNVARDFHDELGNMLASISITSNLLTDDAYIKNKESQEKKIHQIKKDADYLYNGMKDFVWALDHKNDDLHQLQIYLNDFGENLFENSNISFYSSHNISDDKTILPFYWSKQLVLIFKEAMTNTLKHSIASKVTLNFELISSDLKITLKDNGKGFNMNSLKRINGIKNMKFRTKSLNQKISINTKNGVTIIFMGNLKETKNG